MKCLMTSLYRLKDSYGCSSYLKRMETAVFCIQSTIDILKREQECLQENILSELTDDKWNE